MALKLYIQHIQSRYSIYRHWLNYSIFSNLSNLSSASVHHYHRSNIDPSRGIFFLLLIYQLSISELHSIQYNSLYCKHDSSLAKHDFCDNKSLTWKLHSIPYCHLSDLMYIKMTYCMLSRYFSKTITFSNCFISN